MAQATCNEGNFADATFKERALNSGSFGESGVYSRPNFVADYDRFSEVFSGGVADGVRSQGYAVVDGLFGEDWAHAFRDEMQWLVEKGLLIQNRTQFLNAKGQRMILKKPDIYELDLHMEGVRSKMPQLDGIFHQKQFVCALQKQLPEYGLREGPDGVAIVRAVLL
jgi:hypothetical protein